MADFNIEDIEQELARREQINKDMLVPVQGVMGGGFNDPRDGGDRLHKGADISAPVGTPLIAPGNMEFVAGKQGGSKLNSKDWWSYWNDIDTGRQYRFAHHGPISQYKPGDRVNKGDVWGEIGGAIKGPHLHMSIYDLHQGKRVDWISNLGLKRGMNLPAGVTFAEAIGNTMEKKGSKIAATVGNAPSLDELEKEMASRGISLDSIEGEMKSRGISVPQANTVPAELGSTTDTLASYAAPTGEAVGAVIDAPSKYLLRKPLEYLHEKLIEPSRDRTVNEFGKYVQEPGAGAAAPEAFGALPTKEAFVTPLEIALQPGLFNLLGKVTGLPGKMMGAAPEYLMEKALRIPPKSISNKQRSQMIKTALEEKIPVTQRGLNKYNTILDNLDNEVTNIVNSATSQGTEISALNAASRLNDLMDYYRGASATIREQALPKIVEAFYKLASDGNLPVNVAQQMKRTIYREVNKNTTAYGKWTPVDTAIEKTFARGLREEIAGSIPEVQPINKRMSKLLDLGEVLEGRVNQAGNYSIFGAGPAIGSVIGHSVAGNIGGGMGAAAGKLLNMPGFNSNLAIILDRLNKSTPMKLAELASTGTGKAFRYGAPVTAAYEGMDQEYRDKFLRGLLGKGK